MKNLPVDSNSRTIQCAHIGFTKNFSVGVVDKEVTGYVRLKNIGEEDAIVRFTDQYGCDGLVLSPKETEYFYLQKDRQLEIVQGTVNIMF